MRMWMVNPSLMCRQHLLGEHVELHMFVGTLNKAISVAGYLSDNLMEPASLASRHAELVEEMTRRGYDHRSPLPEARQLLRYVAALNASCTKKEFILAAEAAGYHKGTAAIQFSASRKFDGEEYGYTLDAAGRIIE